LDAGSRITSRITLGSPLGKVRELRVSVSKGECDSHQVS